MSFIKYTEESFTSSIASPDTLDTTASSAEVLMCQTAVIISQLKLQLCLLNHDMMSSVEDGSAILGLFFVLHSVKINQKQLLNADNLFYGKILLVFLYLLDQFSLTRGTKIS